MPKRPSRQFGPAPSEAQCLLIEGLGGPVAVAKLVSLRLGLPEHEALRSQAVTQWKRRGIPYVYRSMLAMEAMNRDVKVPPGFLGVDAPVAADSRM